VPINRDLTFFFKKGADESDEDDAPVPMRKPPIINPDDKTMSGIPVPKHLE
jgi:hypothetical protein